MRRKMLVLTSVILLGLSLTACDKCGDIIKFGSTQACKDSVPQK